MLTLLVRSTALPAILAPIQTTRLVLVVQHAHQILIAPAAKETSNALLAITIQAQVLYICCTYAVHMLYICL